MLKVNGIYKKYGNNEVVSDLSFEIGEGEIFALLGDNGAGKSTTLKMIAGIIKPDKGTIKLDLIDKASMLRNLLSGIIPLMVFMAVYMVCMSLAANSIAGDKEKGFLNTLLVTPIKRESLAAGKSISILVVAIIASCSAFIGMAISLPNFAKALKIGENTSYSISDYALLLGAVITGSFVCAVILLIISTVAKDTKQATTLSLANILLCITLL